LARIVLTIGGNLLGNLVLPGIGGTIGGALGGYVGGIIDQQLFGSGTPDQTAHGARLQDLRVQSSSYGSVIPKLYGKGRLSSNIIWMRGFEEEVRTTTETVGGGGKGGMSGGSSRKMVDYRYYCDVALGLCQGPIVSVPRSFADGNALDPANVGEMRVHDGLDTQEPDPLIQAVEGIDRTAPMLSLMAARCRTGRSSAPFAI
jgi:hypothetical protein